MKTYYVRANGYYKVVYSVEATSKEQAVDKCADMLKGTRPDILDFTDGEEDERIEDYIEEYAEIKELVSAKRELMAEYEEKSKWFGLKKWKVEINQDVAQAKADDYEQVLLEYVEGKYDDLYQKYDNFNSIVEGYKRFRYYDGIYMRKVKNVDEAKWKFEVFE